MCNVAVYRKEQNRRTTMLPYCTTQFPVLWYFPRPTLHTAGPFVRLNLLPVGQVRLLQCLTECLRAVGDELKSYYGTSEGTTKLCQKVIGFDLIISFAVKPYD